MFKFILSIDENVHAELERLAEERGISLQELLRAVIIPEWIRASGKVKPQSSLTLKG